MPDVGLLSLLPPILTVVLAVWTRNIIVSLSIGVFAGSMILQNYNPFDATLDMIESRVFVQISVPSNIQIIFTMMAIGGFIRLLEVSGGAHAFARNMTGFITNSARAQVATWISGLMIFFTDSGNALIIGPLFRPIFTELKICREKLAYILDSTASPVCILMPFIGWGAYIMGLIEQSYADTGLTEPALNVLLNVMPYQFYAIFTLAAVPFFILSGRDFGPMARAQRRYEALRRYEEHLLVSPPESRQIDTSEVEAAEPRAVESLAAPLALFVVPLTILLGLIGILLMYFASLDDMSSIHVRSTMTIAYVAASVASAVLMYHYQKVGVETSLGNFIKGAETMVYVVVILILAWSLSSVIKELGTAQTLSTLIGQEMEPALLPAIVFVLGAIISIATGSSWGTFAILMTLAVPVAVNVGAPLYLTIGAVLSGGLFGDHTSPISDTTVLASIGADCAHIDHVSTQLYYALATGMTAFVTFIAAGILDSAWVGIVGLGVLFLVIFMLGRKSTSSLAAPPARPLS
jgi:Na+/H+ antiporter NhaC